MATEKKVQQKSTAAPKSAPKAAASLTPTKVAAIARAEAKEVVNKQVTGFTDFLREQSVVGIAVGLVLGTQIKAVVDQFMLSFVNPFIGIALPGKGTLADKTATLHMFGKTGTFGWGAMAVSLITFVIVAALVYWGYKALKLDKLAKKKDEPKKEEKKEKEPKKDKK